MSDDEFDFGGGSNQPYGNNAGLRESQLVKDQPFDEAIDVSSSESSGHDDSDIAPQRDEGLSSEVGQDSPPGMAHEDHHNTSDEDAMLRDYGGEDTMMREYGSEIPPAPSGPMVVDSEDIEDPEHTFLAAGNNYDQLDQMDHSPVKPGGYKAEEYEALNVDEEVRDLFMHIGRYQPQSVSIEIRQRPFIPEYIPAVGECDGFLKIPRPDGKEDGSGLVRVDEPSLASSDPSILELQLRAASKHVPVGDVAIRSIQDPEANPSLVTGWIQSIQDLHRNNPPPQVQYRKNMPDIEQLMQVWPEDFEAALDELEFPPPSDISLTTEQYADVALALTDIPVYGGERIHPLHLLFSLYSELKSGQFGQMEDEDEVDSPDL
eukprot:TRINITY_DN33054_c0_g1_i1.p1 TRINITY_DN33054_c0_g1~~TRINITY_DN33054_c0_g1_i1.p1  ORF type:complete len:375 (-),score=71.77 TRINITY_DN33054_c0_g1_i1:88-1212(-)